MVKYLLEAYFTRENIYETDKYITIQMQQLPNMKLTG